MTVRKVAQRCSPLVAAAAAASSQPKERSNPWAPRPGHRQAACSLDRNPAHRGVHCASEASAGSTALAGAGLLGAGILLGRFAWKRSGAKAKEGVSTQDLCRLRALIRSGHLLHPMGDGVASFTDMAVAISMVNGLQPEHVPRLEIARAMANKLGGTSRRHVVLVLCDGMGNSIIDQHLPADSFLRTNNQADHMRAVFPATTPAALTTLATAAWPGQHGAPGWELRDQKGCDFPGKPAAGPVQMTILYPYVVDMRTKKPLADFGFTAKDIYMLPPWTDKGQSHRRMYFVNAYNGTDFTNWYQGSNSGDIFKIQETTMETLGTPEGSRDAVQFFQRGADAVLQRIKEADAEGRSTYTYLYTAHPDKHMHRLGVEHEEVRRIMEGLDVELARLWSGLSQFDASMLVTADHGHVTVQPDCMVTIPEEVLACLEFANVGVHGKGRHGYFHCRSGRHAEFEEQWSRYPQLRDNFLLLTIEDAAAEGLFGPEPPTPEVRPRMGDYVAIAIGPETLVSPDEAKKFRDGCEGCSATCQGAHGSLTREELQIPFVLLTPASKLS